MLSRRLLAPLALLVALLPSSLAQEPASVEARRERMLEVAALYAAHEWRAEESNRFHGEDRDGVRVDTPDTSYSKNGWRAGGHVNVGIPYQWGGFSSLDEFDRGVREGKLAGHIPNGKRAGASRFAVGVDCSGLVSRCWDLTEKQSTRSIGGLCYELGSYDELQPGDALNRYDAHVMLFVEFTDEAHTRLRVFEAVNPCVLESEHDVAALKAAGYKPLRYRPLDPRWARDAVDFTRPDVAVPLEGMRRFRATGDAREIALEDLRHPFEKARPGAWSRLRTVTRRSIEDEVEVSELSHGISAAAPGTVRLHAHERQGSSSLDELTSVKRDVSLVDAWIPIVLTAGVEEKARDVLVATSTPGTFTLGERELAAQRLQVELVLYFPAGDREIPVKVVIDAITSEEVPVYGLVQADFRLEIEEGDEPTIAQTHAELLAFAAR